MWANMKLSAERAFLPKGAPSSSSNRLSSGSCTAPVGSRDRAGAGSTSRLFSGRALQEAIQSADRGQSLHFLAPAVTVQYSGHSHGPGRWTCEVVHRVHDGARLRAGRLGRPLPEISPLSGQPVVRGRAGDADSRTSGEPPSRSGHARLLRSARLSTGARRNPVLGQGRRPSPLDRCQEARRFRQRSPDDGVGDATDP